jgi:hypothetical protein
MANHRIVFIPSDKSLGVDNKSLLNIDPIHFSWVPDDIHAFQWYGDELGGEIEFTHPNPFEPKKPNQRLTEMGEWSQLLTLFEEQEQRIEDAKQAELAAFEAARDYWAELREIRTQLFLRSDWTQLTNSPLTEEKVLEWAVYRQELRDLPSNITDPKPMVTAYYEGITHPDWPIPPS